MGVEQEGGEGGVGAGPGDEEEGLSRNEFDGEGVKTDGAGLFEEEGGGGGVVWVGVGGADAKVALEALYLLFLLRGE